MGLRRGCRHLDPRCRKGGDPHGGFHYSRIRRPIYVGADRRCELPERRVRHGGKPFVALNVVGFPTKALELDVLKEVLRGGQEKVAEAGAFLLGGHSVDDREPKYGLVVYGEVRRDSIWKVTGARPGGPPYPHQACRYGIVATAVKADMVEDEAHGPRPHGG